MTKIAVIGGGLSGIQAAVMTAKAGEETVVFDTGESLVQNTSNIKNLVGHDSVGGHELLRKGKDKLESFGGKIIDEKVVSLDRDEDSFTVKTEESEYSADYIIVASAGELDYLGDFVEFEEGVEGPYMMEKHVVTDSANKAADRIYAAGLANTWEYQTSVALGDGSKAAVNLLSDIYGEPYTDHDT
ncbi:FAD-dependent oxidoreductase [Candidatus Nanohalococcus occultus]|uniref:Thioredoxin reductase n=1 Tax=Candidatus Nanohalococcus occultus TaxID=2978047 RepID=A0ABY8CE91_9ARCH|nr:Thioredoxin reductase [Candidatus Nanohaloarchaeota archaeon SVXNc]